MAAQEGYSVCVNYRLNSAAADEVVKQIADSGGHAIAVAANVADENEVARLFEKAADAFGPIAALVNNAGVLEAQSSFSGIDANRLRRILETNVVGAFNCAKEAVRRMSRSNGGSGGGIVNVSSVAARTGAKIPRRHLDDHGVTLFDFVEIDLASIRVAVFALHRQAVFVRCRLLIVGDAFVVLEKNEDAKRRL